MALRCRWQERCGTWQRRQPGRLRLVRLGSERDERRHLRATAQRCAQPCYCAWPGVDFVRADVVDLSSLGDATYDIVYTGGHVAVWVSDLRRYYREAARVLKPNGRLIVSEYHPFRRVWKDSPNRLELGFNYFDRGPHCFEVASDVLYT